MIGISNMYSVITSKGVSEIAAAGGHDVLDEAVESLVKIISSGFLPKKIEQAIQN